MAMLACSLPNASEEVTNYSHHILWMPIHDCVLEIESLEVCDRSGLYLFGETEMATKLGYLAGVKFNKEMLFMSTEKGDVGRRSWLCSI